MKVQVLTMVDESGAIHTEVYSGSKAKFNAYRSLFEYVSENWDEQQIEVEHPGKYEDNTDIEVLEAIQCYFSAEVNEGEIASIQKIEIIN